MRYLLLILSIIVSFESWARCNRNSADSLLREVIHNCKSPTREARIFSVSRITGVRGRNISDAVLNACSNGGCSLITGANRTRCNQEYAQAFINNLTTLIIYAEDSYDCEVDKAKLQSYANSSQASNNNGPFASCFWTNHSVIDPKNSRCGRTAACVGAGYCESGPYRGNQRLQCDAVDNNSKCPSFSDCASAPNPSWVETYTSERHENPARQNRPRGTSRR